MTFAGIPQGVATGFQPILVTAHPDQNVPRTWKFLSTFKARILTSESQSSVVSKMPYTERILERKSSRLAVQRKEFRTLNF